MGTLMGTIEYGEVGTVPTYLPTVPGRYQVPEGVDLAELLEVIEGLFDLAHVVEGNGHLGHQVGGVLQARPTQPGVDLQRLLVLL